MNKNKEILKKLGHKVDESFKYKDSEMVNDRKYLSIDPIKYDLDSRVVFSDLHDMYGDNVDVHGRNIILHDIDMNELKRHFPFYAKYATVWNPKQKASNKSLDLNENKVNLKEAQEKQYTFEEIDNMFRKLASDLHKTQEMIASKGVDAKNELFKKLKVMYRIIQGTGSAEEVFSGYQTVSEDIVVNKDKAIQNPNEFQKTADLAKKTKTNIQLTESFNNPDLRVTYTLVRQSDLGSEIIKSGKTTVMQLLSTYSKMDFTVNEVKTNEVSLYFIDNQNDYLLEIKGSFDEDEAHNIASTFTNIETIEEDTITIPDIPHSSRYTDKDYGDTDSVGKFTCTFVVDNVQDEDLIEEFKIKMPHEEGIGYCSIRIKSCDVENNDGELYVALTGLYDPKTEDLHDRFKHDIEDLVEDYFNITPTNMDCDLF